LAIAELRAALREHRRIALDTCVFIYQWEANPRYSPLTDLIFSSLERGDFTAIISTVTMTELLVHPYQQQDLARVHDLIALLSEYPNLVWLAPDLEMAARAAELRAQHRLQTPDALQAAAAVYANASALVTNDPMFRRVPEFEVLILDDYV